MARLYGAPPSGDPFTDRRRSGIGGSDAGAILGVSPYSSALGVWEAKRGLADDFTPSERMVWGHRLERAVRDGYSEDTGRKVRKAPFMRSKRYPFVVGHPDGLTDDGRVLEVKVTSYLGEQWGEDGSDQIPPHYFAQVQHYLVLTEREVADLAALVGGREMHVYTVPADVPFQEAMLAEEEAFWRRVVDDDPPPPDGSDDARAALRRMYPQAQPDEVEATPEVAQYIESYLTARGMESIAHAEAERWAQLVQGFMGPRERCIAPGAVALWPNRAGGTSWKSVAQSYRDLLVPHYSDDQLDAIIESSKGEPSRSFSVRKEGSK